MKKKLIAFSLILGVVFAGIFLVLQYKAKGHYNKIRDDIDSPVFKVHKIGELEQDYIDTVMANWSIVIEDSPDPVYGATFKLIKFENSVSELVRLYTYEMPEYSLLSRKQNKIELNIAGVLSVITPKTTDNYLYHKDGFAYLKISDRVVDVIQDTNAGVKRTTYTLRKAQQGAASDR